VRRYNPNHDNLLHYRNGSLHPHRLAQPLLCMRTCANCGSEDQRMMLPQEDCTCGVGFSVPDYEHSEGCNCVGHFVVGYIFPQILTHRDLVRDPESSHGYALPPRYRGWELVERPGSGGRQFARRRLLCRKCIVDVVETEERKRSIDKVKREYGRKPNQNWADVMSAAI
jgi:hypothetical protein